MTPRQIELVRSSFTAVEPIADVAATIFYRRLFDPVGASLRIAAQQSSRRDLSGRTAGGRVRQIAAIDRGA
jgi:hypothetical protein